MVGLFRHDADSASTAGGNWPDVDVVDYLCAGMFLLKCSVSFFCVQGWRIRASRTSARLLDHLCG
jgi:hypothetical protein